MKIDRRYLDRIWVQTRLATIVVVVAAALLAATSLFPGGEDADFAFTALEVGAFALASLGLSFLIKRFIQRLGN